MEKREAVEFRLYLQPVQQELAALVTTVRGLEGTYEMIGAAVANIEFMLRALIERLALDTMNAEGPKPKLKAKPKGKVVPFPKGGKGKKP